MFKMAKKILAIDGNSGGASGSSNSKKSKKGGGEDGDFGPPAGGKPKSTNELGDFSKLQDDPRLPLNVRQIFKITKSWKAIARTMCRTGTAMFLNLFEQNEDLYYLFDRFQHLKRSEIQESMELKEHAATVMSTLDQSISSLNDYDNFVSYLRSIGELHRKVPEFRREHFWKIEEPFMKAVKQTLDERCNETIEEIYRIAIKLIIETIADGYGQDQDEPSTGAAGSNNNNNNNNDSGPGNQGDSGSRTGSNGGKELRSDKGAKGGGGGSGSTGCPTRSSAKTGPGCIKGHKANHLEDGANVSLSNGLNNVGTDYNNTIVDSCPDHGQRHLDEGTIRHRAAQSSAPLRPVGSSCSPASSVASLSLTSSAMNQPDNLNYRLINGPHGCGLSIGKQNNTMIEHDVCHDRLFVDNDNADSLFGSLDDNSGNASDSLQTSIQTLASLDNQLWFSNQSRDEPEQDDSDGNENMYESSRSRRAYLTDDTVVPSAGGCDCITRSREIRLRATIAMLKQILAMVSKSQLQQKASIRCQQQTESTQSLLDPNRNKESCCNVVDNQSTIQPANKQAQWSESNIDASNRNSKQETRKCSECCPLNQIRNNNDTNHTHNHTTISHDIMNDEVTNQTYHRSNGSDENVPKTNMKANHKQHNEFALGANKNVNVHSWLTKQNCDLGRQARIGGKAKLRGVSAKYGHKSKLKANIFNASHQDACRPTIYHPDKCQQSENIGRQVLVQSNSENQI